MLLSSLAEFIGTGMLVFLGCMGCVQSLGVVPSHLQITLNFGLTVLLVIQVMQMKQKNQKRFNFFITTIIYYFLYFQCIAHISHAHINPSITLGAFILGKKSLKESILYIIAQTLGGIGGYALLKVRLKTNFCNKKNI